MALKTALATMSNNQIIDIAINQNDCLSIQKAAKPNRFIMNLWQNNQIFGPVEITESRLLTYDQNWTALIKENFVTKKLETEEIFV